MHKLTAFCILLSRLFIFTQAVSLPLGNSDEFVLVDGKLKQKNYADSLNKTWFSQFPDYKLDVLKNDFIQDASLESCIEKESEVVSNQKIIKFEDIAKKAGILHKHRDHMAARPHCVFDFVVPFHNSTKRAKLPGEFCTIEHLTGGIAAGDYDGDGLQDLYFTVFAKRSVLYKNLGNGKFLDVTMESGVGPEKYANGAIWVDIDQDGDLDLYVTTVGDSRHYLYVNYDGIFQEEAAGRGISMEFLSKRKLAGFTPSVGDFDNDGYPDLYVSEWILHSLDGIPSASRLLRNLGKAKPGYFEDVTDQAGVNMDHYWSSRTKFNAGTHTFGASFTDFDNDGLQELLITGDYGESKMFWNNGNMTFTECTRQCGLNADVDAMGHAIGDFNSDGYMEWFSSAIYDNATNCEVSGCMFGNKGNRLFQNLGNKRFKDISDKAGVRNAGWGWGSAFFDFNNDGFLDIVVTNGFDTPSTTIDDGFMKQQMVLYQNYGKEMAGEKHGKMKEVSAEHGLNYKGMGRGLVKLDFDNDGDEDLVVAGNIGRAVFYENVGGSSKNWLRIRAVHRCANNKGKLCDSYGARVVVMDQEGRNQTQEIGSSTHYLGQSEMTAHFGLDGQSQNLTVTVHWPATNNTVVIKNTKSRVVLRVSRPERTGNSVSEFSEFKKCQRLNIREVSVKPGSSYNVKVSKDRQSLRLELHPAVPLHGLGRQVFHYTVQVDSSSNKTSKVSVVLDARIYIRNSTVTSMCPHGRMWIPGMPIPKRTTERTYNGASNNLNNLYWGAALENLRRLVPNRYQDDISMPAGTCSKLQRRKKTCPYPHENSGFGSNRPSPRFISNELCAQKDSIISERGLSDLHVHYGQFFVHDTDFSSPLPRFEFQGNLNEVWMQISVPKNDSHFDQDKTGEEYLPFIRSIYNRCTGQYPNGYPREQVNKISAYIDATSVYGSSKSRCDKLRTMKDGKMKMEDDGLIPKNVMSLDNDNPIGRKPSNLRAAGDTRANVAPGLLAFHTLFVKEHNRLCEEYKKKHPTSTDEEIFQYARKIVIAEHQAIAFREYLPATLGASSIPAYKGYNSNIDVAVSNTFATAAFRFGHSQVNSHIFRLDDKWKMYKHGHILLRESYFHPERVSNEGGIEPILRGMIYMPAQKIDTLLVDELRNALFPVGRGNGLDLASMNIQRGRDHGLPDLNGVRRMLGLRAYTSFSEISKDPVVAAKLEELYKNVDNIDLWVGGLAEEHVQGSELGETFHKIFLEGVLRIRDGDRLWYEKIMSKEEIDMVNSLTLSKIIQLNTGIKDVPANVFFSTKVCKKVENHQCEQHQSKDSKAIEKQLNYLKVEYVSLKKSADNLDEKNDILEAVCIIFGLVMLLHVIIFLVIHLRRKRKNKASQKDSQGNGVASNGHVMANRHTGITTNGKHFANGNGLEDKRKLEIGI